ncbi:hypothetical protein ACFX13_026774 [Malus domestica]|uniref:uncharacterized protein isoform X2 n=1 Tax=Malus domestica TaxID=3750 RepID=UPI000498EC78|nr:uncharacterized protein LOC103448302 isoform X2 [Malus domestica]XP_050115304.1 uncharacterized protein LOC126593301 isoform X2 [Malus sylvestris]
MVDAGMTMSFHTQNRPPLLFGLLTKNRTQYRTKSSSFVAAVQVSSVLQTNESGNLPESKKVRNSGLPLTRCHVLSQPNTVGIIGGVSVYSSLLFLEKLVWWSLKDGGECPPFIVCSDPTLYKELPIRSLLHSLKRSTSSAQILSNNWPVIESLCRKRAFLEHSGARCIVMPCHLSHAWHDQISEDCSLRFLHIGECVARELREAKLKPLEKGSNVRIGVLAADATLTAGFYQEKLQSQGFDVVVPDKQTMEHLVIPTIEAIKRRDMEGARNLLSIAVQVLLVRAVNTVIIASDELQGVLPPDDPLLKKCIDPMDALARSTIKWAKATGKSG